MRAGVWVGRGVVRLLGRGGEGSGRGVGVGSKANLCHQSLCVWKRGGGRGVREKSVGVRVTEWWVVEMTGRREMGLVWLRLIDVNEAEPPDVVRVVVLGVCLRQGE